MQGIDCRSRFEYIWLIAIQKAKRKAISLTVREFVAFRMAEAVEICPKEVKSKVRAQASGFLFLRVKRKNESRSCSYPSFGYHK
jgi:hypothetical protein